MADELEIRVTVTRKASSEAAGADVQLGEVVSMADSTNRQRFLAYMIAQHGLDDEGNQRDQQGMIGAFWAGIEAGVSANIQRHEQEAAAQAARDAVAAFAVTRG